MKNDIVNELGSNFIEYAAAVNTDRAIPDATSGLKPVARRILWSAFSNGQLFSKPHVKSAKIVGNVMGALHPHGDSSIYGALVRLSQSWIMRYPLIDFHGSNGNIAGDGPAASRYTEARLSKIAEEGLLGGIKKRNVPFVPNYSEDEEEPLTLPSLFPNLLCNPNSGIGVALACNWLPHNLKEVCQAIFDYLDGKEPMLPGPDFPTGGIIINKNDIPNIMKTGHGSVKVRGKYRVEDKKIIFYEIPYNTSTEALLTEISKVCEAKEIEGIKEIRDESNKKGLRLVIECGKTVDPESIVQKLFLKTNLQNSISYNQVALVNKVPTELNLIDCIKIYINHNIECLLKEINFDLQKAKIRLNIVLGLLIALEDIDNIITLIKKSDNAAAAKESLIAKYNLNEPQAKAILDMKLSKLAKLEKVNLEQEKQDLLKFIEEQNAIIQSHQKQIDIIKERLSNLVKKYGDLRRTELVQIDIKKEDKEIATITPENCVVVVTKTGDIKRIPSTSFRVQRRNGKGVKTEQEAILETISTNTIDNLMIFTNTGKMYRILVDNLPIGTNASKGINLKGLIPLEDNEKVIAVTSLAHKTDKTNVVFITKQGLVKKTLLEEYKSMKKSTGINAIKLNEQDSLANVLLMNEEDLILITTKGMAIHFTTKDIAAIGRVTMGVKAIKLNENDSVLCGIPITKQDQEIILISSNGMGKKMKIEEVPIQGRNGKGVCIFKTNENTLVGGLKTRPQDSILLVGIPNGICINEQDIPIQTKVGQGVSLIKESKVLRAVVL